MSQDRPSPKTIEAIKTLWQNRVPPKIISEVLGIKYPVTSLYCRSFKAISKQLDPIIVVAKTLAPHHFHNNAITNNNLHNNAIAREILDNLLADGE